MGFGDWGEQGRVRGLKGKIGSEKGRKEWGMRGRGKKGEGEGEGEEEGEGEKERDSEEGEREKDKEEGEGERERGGFPALMKLTSTLQNPSGTSPSSPSSTSPPAPASSSPLPPLSLITPPSSEATAVPHAHLFNAATPRSAAALARRGQAAC